MAKWAPASSSWVALGSGVNGPVHALAVDGSKLYVGGEFSQASGIDARGIAVWDGSSWKALGTGVNGTVEAIAISYGYIYLGGALDTAGGTPVNAIARWKR